MKLKIYFFLFHNSGQEKDWGEVPAESERKRISNIINLNLTILDGFEGGGVRPLTTLC